MREAHTDAAAVLLNAAGRWWRVEDPDVAPGDVNALLSVFGLAENTCGCLAGPDHDPRCVYVDARRALERMFGRQIPRLHGGHTDRMGYALQIRK
jgi:hypothetical protein